jgi:transposase-like protein
MERTKNYDTSRSKNLKQQWQRHIKDWRASGETQISFCQKHGLSRHAFQYWKHNFEKGKTNGFVELSRTTPPDSSRVVEIVITNPVHIRVPQGVSSEHLHMVLQTVKEL